MDLFALPPSIGALWTARRRRRELLCLPGRTIKSDLTQNTLDDLFRSVGGQPPKSQIDEVEKAKATVQGELSQAQDLAAKKAALTKFLVPLQQTGADREKMREAIAAAKDDAALNPLAEQLTNAFEQAKSDSANGVKRDLAARKAAIADLLYNLYPDSNWHARADRSRLERICRRRRSPSGSAQQDGPTDP